VIETVRVTVMEKERELVGEKELVGVTVKVPVRETVMERDWEVETAAPDADQLGETPAAEPVDVDTLVEIPEPAEVETLVDNPPPAEAEREMLTVTPPLVALMLPETVPEQSLRTRALV